MPLKETFFFNESGQHGTGEFGLVFALSCSLDYCFLLSLLFYFRNDNFILLLNFILHSSIFCYEH